ncbi:response regulator transcription factor [Gracilibacillus alcaliphilus]|uniref:response regulator transcription factor n=1 Tax=Gracilibacillus alcaliphilus TaxID=1401441 RepID=UPI00195AB049|nr:response regulator [Gracilibacillus alcaliphilus]MBM7679058.1 two-component system response regulator YesN [Gracilibacillus alcaliphilus]
MYRLLIVDDEPIIVDGLIQLFVEQEELHVDLYSAYSVKAAMAQAVKVKIDILITDMRMPEKNGLRLVDELQALWPQCRIIFLSGYDTFDYVYDAVKRNIDSYILKTESDDVLLQAVQKSITKIEEERSLHHLIESSKRQYDLMIPYAKRDLLEMAVKGEYSLDHWNHSMIDKSIFTIHLNEPWLTIAAKIEEQGLTKANRSRQQCLYYLQHLFQHELHEQLAVEYVTVDQLAVWFVQPKQLQGVFYEQEQPQWLVIKEYLKGFLENGQENCYRLTQMTISFVLSEHPSNLDDVSEDFAQVDETIKMMSYFSGEMMIVDLSEENPFLKGKLASSKTPTWKNDLHILESMIIEGDYRQAMDIIDRLFEGLFHVPEYSKIEVTEFLYAISHLLLGFLHHKDLYHFVGKDNDAFMQEVMGKIPIILDSKEKIAYLTEKICAYQLMNKKEGKNNIITFVNKYIKEHIAGDLSLVAIAKAVHFNPSYLSRFYKEQSGTNISDYINQLKLHKAEYYLSETDLFIQDIACKLGFSSPSYFTMFFRKYKNQSPQDYREQYLRSK